jgi:hypothetical protein
VTVAVVALAALNALTLYLNGRREARLIDALKTNTPGEYLAARRAEAKPAKTPKPPIDEDAPNIYTAIGL